MAKSENKTKPTRIDPKAFIATVEDERRRQDAEFLLRWFGKLTGLKPVMWGPSMIGFGSFHYKYDSGHEGDSFLTGFSPRKQDLVVYVLSGYETPTMQRHLARLGKHRVGKSCLYLKRLSDIDMEVLGLIVSEGLVSMRKRYPEKG